MARKAYRFFWIRRESSWKEIGREREETERKSLNHGRIAWRIWAAVMVVDGGGDDGVVVEGVVICDLFLRKNPPRESMEQRNKLHIKKSCS